MFQYLIDKLQAIEATTDSGCKDQKETKVAKNNSPEPKLTNSHSQTTNDNTTNENMTDDKTQI